MPVNRTLTEGLADEMYRLYAEVEVELLRQMARYLAAGVDAPDWQQEKLLEVQTFRRNAERMMTAAERKAVHALTVALTRAYNVGQAAAQGELDGADLDAPPPRQAEQAVAALVRDAQGTIQGLRVPILREAEDKFRRAVYETVAGTLTGSETRLDTTKRMLRRLANDGVAKFIDKSGRRWSLRSYAEMATRTASAHAMVTGHLDRLEDAGIPLVVVSNSSRECEVCRPWEGRILSRGPVAALQQNMVTGKMERVDVHGTVEEATRAGLFHPNCTHNLSGYIHGATKVNDADSNPQGYRDRQRLRAMERNLRLWKQRQAVIEAALTAGGEGALAARAMKPLADSKVAEWSAAIVQHVEATGLPRKRNRESPTGTR